MNKKIISVVTIVMMAISVFLVPTDLSCAASANDYWLKVNRTANVVNVYKKIDGSWQPYKVMLCSCGKKGSRTPTGNYKIIKEKRRWHNLFHGVSGQYTSRFKGHYLFHSVVYRNKGKHNSCIRREYNKLGTNASHGCVRLATMDAKWIYDNCPRGTKVTVYSSRDAGPLGNPKKVAMAGKRKNFWDPTDPIKRNKYFRMRGPEISINKPEAVEYGTKFNIMENVSARSPYTFENLTSRVKVHSIAYRAEGSESFKAVSAVDTNKAGSYRIKYSCYNAYCGRNTVYSTFTFKVLPPPEDVQAPSEEQADIQSP
ncbi:MAG: L,D-transpeptidase family protein [Lentihominibacter sp.]|jgi:hypothetical protein